MSKQDGLELLQIPFNDQIINIGLGKMDEDIDIEQCTFIDYNNLFAEIVTNSTVLNRIGLLKAEADNIYDEYKFEVDIYAAQLAERFRKEIEKPTVDKIENCVTLDPVYQNMKKKLFRLKKEAAYMESSYKAINSKDFKLPKLLDYLALVPIEHEIEISEKKWNGIPLSMREKLIK